MSLQLVSISHKTASLELRRLFSFSDDEKREFLKAAKSNGIEECVLISTCNRTEVYIHSNLSERKGFETVQKLLEQKAEGRECGSIFRFYSGDRVISHLFEVAAGLDSLIVGEDQILGQVKEGYELAFGFGATGYTLNTLFRYAVTAAKRVKTDTDLSKTPVSTATIAVKAAENHIGDLEGKNIMVIGATGKIGSIVVKNLVYTGKSTVFAVGRDLSHAPEGTIPVKYDERYDYIDKCDAVISATASPHYTVTKGEVQKRLITDKKRAFVDLAVPADIEMSIGTLEGCAVFTLDDFGRIARENNAKKLEMAESARMILEKYQDECKNRLIFRRFEGDMLALKEIFLKDCERKNAEKAFEKFFFRVRESAKPEAFEGFMECVRLSNQYKKER